MKRQERIRLNKTLRKRRTRASIHGTSSVPRVSLFRSNRYLSVQLIDDEVHRTLIGLSTRQLEEPPKKKMERATVLGARLAEEAQRLHIKRAVLHRGAYRYHGQVKAFADAARNAGLSL